MPEQNYSYEIPSFVSPEIEGQFIKTLKTLADITNKSNAVNEVSTKRPAEPTIPESGEVQIMCAVYKGRVVIDLGKPVKAIRMTPLQALELAGALRRNAEEIDHELIAKYKAHRHEKKRLK